MSSSNLFTGSQIDGFSVVSKIAGLPRQITKRVILELLNLTRPSPTNPFPEPRLPPLAPGFHSRRLGPKLNRAENVGRDSSVSAMPRSGTKSFRNPEQVRRFPNGRIETVSHNETTIGRFHMEPGWRWSRDVGPIAQTRSCQIHHQGVVLRGRLRVEP